MTPAEFKQKLGAGYREALEATAKEFGVSPEECAKVIVQRMQGRAPPRDIAPSILSAMEAACPTEVLKDLVRRGGIPEPSTAGAGGTVSAVRINPGLPGTTSGWRLPAPIGPPPGVSICDAMMDAQDRRERVELAERIARQKLATGS
jgi:hypothetical protein